MRPAMTLYTLRAPFILFACALFVLFAMGTGVVCSTSAAQAAPLLLEGKKTLFQRVVSHPGARLVATPGTDAAVVKESVTPFTVFYVYARTNGWIQVGTGTASAEGWLEAAKTTEWNQSLTLLFTPLLVRFMGPTAAISCGGASTVDTTLPVITRYAGNQWVFISIVHALVLDFSVPFWVTFFCSI